MLLGQESVVVGLDGGIRAPRIISKTRGAMRLLSGRGQEGDVEVAGRVVPSRGPVRQEGGSDDAVLEQEQVPVLAGELRDDLEASRADVGDEHDGAILVELAQVQDPS